MVIEWLAGRLRNARDHGGTIGGRFFRWMRRTGEVAAHTTIFKYYPRGRRPFQPPLSLGLTMLKPAGPLKPLIWPAIAVVISPGEAPAEGDMIRPHML